jgi:hypothetical protein
MPYFVAYVNLAKTNIADVLAHTSIYNYNNQSETQIVDKMNIPPIL